MPGASTNDPNGAEPLLTLPQLAAVAAVEYRTIHTWVRRGLIAPTYVSRGPGTPNLFRPEDAVGARIIGDLRRAGLDLDTLQRCAEGINRAAKELNDDAVLVVNGEVEIVGRAALLGDVLGQGEPAVIYAVAWARQAVDGYLARAAS